MDDLLTCPLAICLNGHIMMTETLLFFFFFKINSKKETSGSQKKTQDKCPKTGSVKKEKAVKPDEGNELF